MDLEGGLTPIDTLYEWSGLVMSERFASTLLWSWGLVGTLVAAALLRLLYVAYQRGNYFDLVAYPVYLSFMLFLLHPIQVNVRPKSIVFNSLWSESAVTGVEWSKDRGGGVAAEELTVKVPRIVGLSQKIMETAVRRMIRDVRENTDYTLFRWQAVVAAREQAAILDSGLRLHFHGFLRQCYWPARARQGLTEEAVDPTKVTVDDLPILGRSVEYPEDMEIDLFGSPESCRGEQNKIQDWIWSHVEKEEVHRQALKATLEEAKRTGGTGSDRGRIETQYVARILYNETFTKVAENEIALLRQAIPEYKSLDQRYFATADQWSLRQGISGALSWLGGIMEGASQETIGPTLYYRLTLVAPYLFGLLQAIWLMGFPIAALWSLWPGCAKVIVHYLSSWASIKIWPVFWTWLSNFNVGRLSLPTEDPLGLAGTGGSAAMFTSIAMMYVLIPVLSLLLFNLAAKAGMVSIGNFVGGGTGAGPAIGLAAAGARTASGAVAHMGANG